jgi:hypothetical protein
MSLKRPSSPIDDEDDQPKRVKANPSFDEDEMELEAEIMAEMGGGSGGGDETPVALEGTSKMFVSGEAADMQMMKEMWRRPKGKLYDFDPRQENLDLQSIDIDYYIDTARPG